MNRRDFIKYGSAGLSLPFWLQSCQFSRANFPIYLQSDHATGHLIFQSDAWPVKRKITTGTVIVGGGLAGVTAAYQLRDQDFQLFELSHELGGTSGATTYNGIRFSQGAHYDLAYPEEYGSEVLKLLEELNIVRYEPWKKSWGFVDQQHVIPAYREQRCFTGKGIRKEVIERGPLKDQFVALVKSYTGKLNLPTRLIANDLRYLNDTTFADLVAQEISNDRAFKHQLDYHMKDDYGGTSDQVSALAGLAYFACRRYYTESVDLFSPPNGNDYFVQRISDPISKDRLKTNHLVKSIQKDGEVYRLEVLDVRNKEKVEVVAEQVIYAGQKHALKYIFPDQYPLFDNNYAPWIVVNLVTKQVKNEYGFWQNEYLEGDGAFIGFVNSSVQSQAELKGYQVFTGYYCLPESDRAYLTSIDENKEKIANQTREYIEEVLGRSISVEACHIKVMGHAMPIPKPGYLFQDANDDPKAKMIYAGVDNGRLPLLFEALDSGVVAAKLV